MTAGLLQNRWYLLILDAGAVLALVVITAHLVACPGPETPRNPDDNGPAEDSTEPAEPAAAE